LLVAELANLDAKEKWFEYELQDPFVEMMTPDVSSDEAEESGHDFSCYEGLEPSDPAHRMLDQMLSSTWKPAAIGTGGVTDLYTYRKMLIASRKKHRVALVALRNCNFKEVHSDPRFWAEVYRMRDTYISSHGRDGLRELLGKTISTPRSFF